MNGLSRGDVLCGSPFRDSDTDFTFTVLNLDREKRRIAVFDGVRARWIAYREAATMKRIPVETLMRR